MTHGSDGLNFADWRHLAKEERLSSLTSLSFGYYWFPHLVETIGLRLTRLNLIGASWYEELMFTGMMTSSKLVSYQLFPLLPPTLLYLRANVCRLREGNVFALLPPKLVELHIHGCKESFSKGLNPLIPVDQLFHLPISITRLTLPAYDWQLYSSHALRIHGPNDVALLQLFFSQRPQIASFSIWRRNRFKGSFKDKEAPHLEWFYNSYQLPSFPPEYRHIIAASSSRIALLNESQPLADEHHTSSPRQASSPTQQSFSSSSAQYAASGTTPPSTESPQSSSSKPHKEKKPNIFSRLLTGLASKTSSVVALPPALTPSPSSSSPASTPASATAIPSSHLHEHPSKFTFKKPETTKTRYPQQLAPSLVTSAASALPPVLVHDSAFPVDNGFSTFWAKQRAALP